MSGEQRTRFVNRATTPNRIARTDVDVEQADEQHDEEQVTRRRDDLLDDLLDEQATVRRPSVLDLPPEPPLTLDEDVDEEMPTTTKR